MIKLNIGSGGKRLLKGYVNIDKFNKKADKVAPADKTGYQANSVDEIFASHLIEHIEPKEFNVALAHWYTILKKKGKLVLLCPNAMVYISEWMKAAEDNDVPNLKEWARRNVLGWEGKGEGMLNRNLFTPNFLKSVVEEAQFKVISCEVSITRIKNDKHFEYRKDGDIKLEAIKP